MLYKVFFAIIMLIVIFAGTASVFLLQQHFTKDKREEKIKEIKKEINALQKEIDLLVGNKQKPEEPKVEEKKSPDSSYIVKKGDSLWKINKQLTGQGIGWAKLFALNKQKIKNPNLIYPGQNFILKGNQ